MCCTCMYHSRVCQLVFTAPVNEYNLRTNFRQQLALDSCFFESGLVEKALPDLWTWSTRGTAHALGITEAKNRAQSLLAKGRAS